MISYLARRKIHTQLASLTEAQCGRIGAFRSNDDNILTAARFLGWTENALRTRLDSAAPLLRFGLIDVNFPGDVEANETLVRIATAPTQSPKVLRNMLVGSTHASTSLDWSDFAHLGEEAEYAKRLLNAALRDARPGANLLLHGVPGSGKTEFAKRVACEVGADLIAIGEADHLGGEPNRSERLSHLLRAQSLVMSGERIILFVDEADDIFVGNDSNRRSDRSGSKVFLNRVLEATPIPVIWATNDAGSLGLAALRRMAFAIEFRTPPAKARATVLARTLAAYHCSLATADIRALARQFPVGPALFESAVKTAAALGGGADEIRKAITAVGRVAAPNIMRGMTADAMRTAFDPRISRADCDLVRLAEQIGNAPWRALSLCLTGQPGTGKSAYARYLAEIMDLEVIEKQSSDIFGMFVGQTERAIADAFREAIDQNAFLIFDEADSLLRKREFAVRSWEVSQVNEMLTWMERHPLPFACTTNLAADLDVAALRRFTFKVEFLAMNEQQAALSFMSWFAAPAPASLAALEALTPGDFAVVARKARILGAVEPEQLVSWLRNEVDARAGLKSSPIGFSASL
ncbi:SpoVK/Ycf46/Vps4 family AAA+-type ATPase [Rhodoligotrophos appendicifer]|uniref:AAA family ATPase n=1 Tax=Rhodoligotrophos appendicifer TaxID=987056 RepID=UPI0014795E35|nr:ATP-binding protein [Rhodoligotrophos appendicifer]